MNHECLEKTAILIIGTTLLKKYWLEETYEKLKLLSAKYNTIIIIKNTSKTMFKIIKYKDSYIYCLPRLFLSSILTYSLIFSPIIVTLLFLKRIKIIIAQDPLITGFTACLCRKITRLFGINTKLIVEFHGDWLMFSPFYRRSSLLQPLVKAWYFYLLKFTVMNADALRFVSKYLFKRAISLIGNLRGKITAVFPPFINISLFKRDEVRKDKNLLLFIGDLHPIKGIDILIEAFKEVMKTFPNTKLIMVGSGIYKRKITRLLKGNKKLSSHILLFDELSRMEIAHLLNKALVLILPSRIEGFGRVLVEANASKTAVIATSVGGIPELIEHKVNGLLVKPSDVEALASCIKWALRNTNETLEMGKRGRLMINKKFTAEYYTKNIDKLVSCLLMED